MDKSSSVGGSPSFQIVLLGAFLFFVLFPLCRQPVTTDDTPSYTSFAEDILSGDLFAAKPVKEIPDYALIRTPGYPLVIASARMLGAKTDTDLLLVHLFIGVASFALVIVLLLPAAPPLLTGVPLLIAYYDALNFMPQIMTEWFSFCLLMILYALTVRYLIAPRTGILFWCGFVVSVIVLTRPALIVAAPLPFILAAVKNRPLFSKTVAGAFLAALISFFPIFIWMGFNCYRVSSFSLTVFDGFGLFGNSSMIGFAELHPDDSEDLKSFISYVNSHKYPPAGKEKEFVAALSKNYEARFFNHNVYRVAGAIRAREGWNAVRLNTLMKQYALRAIKGNLLNYLLYVKRGLVFFLLHQWFLIASVLFIFLAFLLAKERGDYKTGALGTASVITFGLHFLHCFLCATMGIVVFRYYFLTFYPFAFTVTVTALFMGYTLYKTGCEAGQTPES